MRARCWPGCATPRLSGVAHGRHNAHRYCARYGYRGAAPSALPVSLPHVGVRCGAATVRLTSDIPTPSGAGVAPRPERAVHEARGWLAAIPSPFLLDPARHRSGYSYRSASATATRDAPRLGQYVISSAKRYAITTKKITFSQGIENAIFVPLVKLLELSRLRERIAPPTTPAMIPITAMKLDSSIKLSATVLRW